MQRLLLAAALAIAVLAAPACDDGGASPSAPADAVGDVQSPYAAENFTADTRPADDATTPLYPGHVCDTDDECSTGLCWGKATAQGHFLDKVCQLECVAREDFSTWCDSDADCCEGHCCVGCGAREGLCVKD